MQNGIATLEKSLAVSHKDKYTLSILPSYSILVLKRNENVCPHIQKHGFYIGLLYIIKK